MGSHLLNVEAARFIKPVVPRRQRLCSCCDLQKREDELHFVYECPLYSDLRLRYLDSVGSCHHGSMNKCMNGVWRKKNSEVMAHAFWVRMASFIHHGMCRRDQYLFNQQQVAAL